MIISFFVCILIFVATTYYIWLYPKYSTINHPIFKLFIALIENNRYSIVSTLGTNLLSNEIRIFSLSFNEVQSAEVLPTDIPMAIIGFQFTDVSRSDLFTDTDVHWLNGLVYVFRSKSYNNVHIHLDNFSFIVLAKEKSS